MTPKLARLALAVTFLVSLGCAQVQELASSATELAALGGALAQEYPGETIQFEIQRFFNGGGATDILTLYFINSRYNDLPYDQQEQQARAIAEFTTDHYASISEIEVLQIVFRRHSEVAFVSSDVDSAFEFDPADLIEPALDTK